jgi:VanZ family protein
MQRYIIRFIIWLKPYARYLFIAWLIAILAVSSIPRLPTLKIHTAHSVIRLDYLIHFCEYGILAFMAHLAFTDEQLRIRFKKFMIITIGIVLFAFLDEFHQKLIPGRTFNTKDIISNLAGIVAASVFCIIVFRSAEIRLKKPD